jgi:Rrf2 family cysteine metabolism transcriptional repressor
MKLSTRGRYGLRALLDLALHRGEGSVPLKDIARRQEISLPYLEHLITPLVAAGLVKSTRGARGGVLLLKPPADIKLGEVVQFLEGPIALVDCVNNPALCHRSAFCVTRDIWVEMKEAMSQVLDSTTLQDLVERQRQKGQVETELHRI